MKTATHCPTQKDYDRLMKAYEEETDIKWVTRVKPTENNHWHCNKDKTCIEIQEHLTFCSIEYFTLRDYTIETVDETINRLKRNMFEVGDILVNRKNSEVKVLAVRDLLTALSDEGDFKKSYDWYTEEELEHNGWTKKDPNEAKKQWLLEGEKGGWLKDGNVV